MRHRCPYRSLAQYLAPSDFRCKPRLPKFKPLGLPGVNKERSISGNQGYGQVLPNIPVLLMIVIVILSASCQRNREMVVGKVQKASKLSTTEFKIDKLVFGVKDKRVLWVIKLNRAEFLAQSQVIIKAGINLEKLREEDISVSGNKINIKLPPVEVITFSYPAEQFKKIDFLSKGAFTTKITLEDQERFFRDAELDIRNSLQYMGIVETTQRKTKIMLEAMLRNLGYTEIYLDFKEGDLIVPILENTDS